MLKLPLKEISVSSNKGYAKEVMLAEAKLYINLFLLDKPNFQTNKYSRFRYC